MEQFLDCWHLSVPWLSDAQTLAAVRSLLHLLPDSGRNRLGANVALASFIEVVVVSKLQNSAQTHLLSFFILLTFVLIFRVAFLVLLIIIWCSCDDWCFCRLRRLQQYLMSVTLWPLNIKYCLWNYYSVMWPRSRAPSFTPRTGWQTPQPTELARQTWVNWVKWF